MEIIVKPGIVELANLKRLVETDAGKGTEVIFRIRPIPETIDVNETLCSTKKTVSYCY